ncbi:MAG TPA: ankyrin repeat domain-containing protein [Stellaceae bacterium]|nr:ankyrin repeat domain-containing protein [Stellaceae bacterium]
MDLTLTRRDLFFGMLATFAAGYTAALADGLFSSPDWYTLANAAEQNKEQDVAALIRRGDNPNFLDSNGRMPLSYAAASGNTAILKMLLEAGARADYRDSSGATALHWAAQMGHPEVIKMLVEANATVDAQNRQGITPLMLAATNTKVEAIRVLVAAGADPKKQDFSGRDAIGWATGKPSSLRAVQSTQKH